MYPHRWINMRKALCSVRERENSFSGSPSLLFHSSSKQRPCHGLHYIPKSVTVNGRGFFWEGRYSLQHVKQIHHKTHLNMSSRGAFSTFEQSKALQSPFLLLLFQRASLLFTASRKSHELHISPHSDIKVSKPW